MRARRAFVVAVLLMVAAFGACTLNPQPLPPFEEGNNAGGDRPDATAAMDAAARPDDSEGTGKPPAPEPLDAGEDADDAGVDASDDASVDASDDADSG